MKKVLLYLFVFVCVGIVAFQPTTIQTNPTTPPLSHSGAPGDASCGKTSCHNTAVSTTTGAVTIGFGFAGDITTYSPGDTLVVSVTVLDASKARAGFQLLNLDGSSQTQGSYIASTGTLLTQTATSGSKIYHEHKNIPASTMVAGMTVWEFKWIAPMSNVGNITFYAGAIAGNNNSSPSGDANYQTNKVLSFAAGLNDQLSSDLVHIGPNPAQDFLYFTTEKTVEYVSIYSINGSLAKENISFEDNKLDVSDLNNGMYMIVFQTKEGNIIHKFIK